VVEEPLAGGFVNDVVRVGDTVRRTAGDRTAFVQALLCWLAEQGWTGSPRFLGLDDQGREMLTFIEGQVGWQPALRSAVDAEAALVTVASLVRELHDLTAGTRLARGAEVVCHNDLSPRNTVYRAVTGGWEPVAFIDWDLAAPGERIHDLAHVCWQFLGLGPEVTDITRAARHLRLICDSYGLADRAQLLDTILWWQDRCWRGIEAGAAAGQMATARLRDRGAASQVRAAFAWTRAHRMDLETELR
jgi:hypothetical protein